MVQVELGQRLIDTEYALTIFQWSYLVNLVLVFLTFFVAKFSYGLPYLIYFRKEETKFSLKDQLVEKDNKAVAISYGGYLFAVSLILWASLTDLTEDQGLNILYVIVYQILGMILLFIARLLNDWLVVRGNNVRELVYGKNIAVACVEAGSMIGAGQVAMSSISGEITNWGEDIASTFLYFAFGQIAFIIFAKIYELMAKSKYSVAQEVKEVNIAAGVSFGANLIAVGILVSSPIIVTDSMAAFWLWFALGVVVMILLRLAVNFILLGGGLNKEIAEDKNWGAALIEGTMEILIALIITNFMRDSCWNP